MKIFLIGPGGVGKSTCGALLADLLGYKFIDLDNEFNSRLANITTYIKTSGYEKYCFANSKLFYELLETAEANFVFALSSGFLVHENLDDLTQKHQQTLKDLGISVLLLPSESLEHSTKVIVPRQLQRGFGLNADTEKTKFIRRFPIYKNLGDLKIFSTEQPKIIAEIIKKGLENLSNTKI